MAKDKFTKLDDGRWIDSQSNVRAIVQEPRGDWNAHHLTVELAGDELAGPTLIEGPLVEKTVRNLHGSGDGLHTCATVYQLVETAASDFPELVPLFDR